MLVMSVEPVTLEGRLVRLEPLAIGHAEGLFAAAQDPLIWRFMPYDPSQHLEDMRKWIETALQARAAGTEFPFATIERESGRVLGSTRYMTIEPRFYGLEIGSTWLTSSARRTGINTECKYLLLRHAFEVLRAIRVQLKTDSRNNISQRAIERIGAVKEGTLRNHMILPDGYRRHSVYYSITEDEWPTVKADLETKMSHQPG